MLSREQYLIRKAVMDQKTIENSGLCLSFGRTIQDSDSLYLANELSIVEAKVIEHFPTETTHRKLWKVTNQGAGLKSIDYAEIMRSGQSSYTAYSATDIPNAAVKRTSTPSPVRKAKIKYTYELEDIDYMRRAGISLDPQMALAAKEGNEYTFNQTAWFGRKDLGLKGFFSYAQDGMLSNPTRTNSVWASNTAEQIWDDLLKLKKAADVDTKGAIDNNVLAVGITNYYDLKETYFTLGGIQTSESVFDRIMKTGLFDRVEKCPELDSVTVADVVTAQNVAIAFSDREDVFKRQIPVEIIALPIQQSGFTFTVYMHADDGGLFLYRKYGGAYMINT